MPYADAASLRIVERLRIALNLTPFGAHGRQPAETWTKRHSAQMS